MAIERGRDAPNTTSICLKLFLLFPSVFYKAVWRVSNNCVNAVFRRCFKPIQTVLVNYPGFANLKKIWSDCGLENITTPIFRDGLLKKIFSTLSTGEYCFIVVLKVGANR